MDEFGGPEPVLLLMIGFLEAARRAKSLVDVNIAAGIALEELAVLGERTDEPLESEGELVNFRLETG